MQYTTSVINKGHNCKPYASKHGTLYWGWVGKDAYRLSWVLEIIFHSYLLLSNYSTVIDDLKYKPISEVVITYYVQVEINISLNTHIHTHFI